MSGVTRAVYSKYDLNNNRTRVNYGDGVYFDYGFDNLNRMGVIFEGAGIRTLQIDFNPDGNRRRTNYSFTNGIQLDGFTQDFAGTGNDLTNSFNTVLLARFHNSHLAIIFITTMEMKIA